MWCQEYIQRDMEGTIQGVTETEIPKEVLKNIRSNY